MISLLFFPKPSIGDISPQAQANSFRAFKLKMLILF